MKIKICKKCKKEKEINNFYKYSYNKNLYRPMCKDCTKDEIIKYHEENPEKKIEIALNRSGKNRCHMNKYCCEWRRNNKDKVKMLEIKYKIKSPEKILARIKVNNALQYGKINKGNCEYPNCKYKNRIIQGHHWGYDKPLVVNWFCSKHHVLVDKVKKLIKN